MGDEDRGTTDDTAAAFTAARSMPASRNSSRSIAAYSSAVRPLRVSIRQSARSLRSAVEQTERDVGVADVDGEQQGAVARHGR